MKNATLALLKRNKIKHTSLIITLMLSQGVYANTQQYQSLEQATVVKHVGFELPESVLHDTKSDVYLVSNIAGKIPAKDDNGFISKVSPEGKVLSLKWINGESDDVTLHSPKGLALYGDRLYVADIDTVRVFDRNSGKAIDEVHIEGTTFLNDIVVDSKGFLYTSESALVFEGGGIKGTGKDAIYRLSPELKVTTLKQDKSLAKPNGLEVLGDGSLGVVSRGDAGFYILGKQGNKTRSVTLPVTKLDGLVQLGNKDFLASSWETSSVYRITPDDKVTKVAKFPVAAANIGYDSKRKKLLLPLLKTNQIAFLNME